MSSCGHSLAAVSVVYNERKWLEKKRTELWEHKDDARGFMCNSSLRNWPLCSMSLVSFPKEYPVVATCFCDCWKITWLRWERSCFI